jgi:predicted phosphodiesterase
MAFRSHRRPLQFQVHSDIHLEKYPHRRLRPKCSRLILAGDIGVPVFLSYKEFFRDTSRQFDTIVYVLGNHEYERIWMGIDKTNELLLREKFVERNVWIKDILSEFKNIILLDKDWIEMDGRKIFGTTLWTNYHQRKSNRTLSSVETFITQKHFEILPKIQESHPDLLITHFVSNRSVLKKSWNIGLGPSSILPASKAIFGHIHYPIFEPNVICNPWGEEVNPNEVCISLD